MQITDSLEKPNPDALKDWRLEEKRTIEDEMVGWHHWLNGNEFEHTLGVVDGQGSLACCSLWGHKESDMTEQLNWATLNGLDVFPTVFNWSLNFAIKYSWSEPQSAASLVFDDFLELLHLWLKRNTQSDFGIGHLVMSICRVFFALLEDGVYYDQCILLANLW